MKMTSEDINALGQAMDTSWGKTANISPTISVKSKFYGEGHIEVTYTTLVSFSDPSFMNRNKHNLEEEAAKTIKAYMKYLKREFKEVAGRELNESEKVSQNNVELTYYNTLSPLRRAYFRRKTIFEVK